MGGSVYPFIVARQQLSTDVPANCLKHGFLCGLYCINENYFLPEWVVFPPVPYGGGLEYLHRRPASRKRRQKGNTVSNETVLRDLDARVTALARPSSNCTILQTSPLVREGAPCKERKRKGKEREIEEKERKGKEAVCR
jgi:hypothetical protein